MNFYTFHHYAKYKYKTIARKRWLKPRMDEWRKVGLEKLKISPSHYG